MSASIAKLVESGAIMEKPPDMPLKDGTKTSLGAVVKNSDRHRCISATGLDPRSEDILSLANPQLEAIGQPPIKVRPVWDITASGVNDKVAKPPHSQPNIDDHLAIVFPGCWLVKMDVSSYYSNFPMAIDWWSRVMFFWMQVWYIARCILFGLAGAPHYCSTFSAEFRRWFVALGFPTSHIMDDWLFAQPSREEALVVAEKAHSIFAAIRLPMNPDKDVCAQSLVFAGFLIDSNRMTLTFPRESVRGFIRVLKDFRKSVSDQTLRLDSLRSVAGKLNDYANRVQLGRLHVRSLWKAIPLVQQDEDLPALLQASLLRDIDFWSTLLRQWAADCPTGKEFPILNSSIFEHDAQKILCLITDASGLESDGFGGVEAWLFDEHYVAFAVAWLLFSQLAAHSHGLELQALLWWLERTQHQNIILFWFSDCASAVWSVNKGYCANQESFDILFRVLSACDSLGIWIVAWWIPREWNLLADYLSHLTRLIDRPEFSGSISELSATVAAVSVPSATPGEPSHVREVPTVLPSPPNAFVSGDSPPAVALSLQPRHQESRVGEIANSDGLSAQEFLPATSYPLVGRSRLPSPPRGNPRASISGRDPFEPEGSPESPSSLSDFRPTLGLRRGSNVRGGRLDRARWSSSRGRTFAPIQGARYSVGSSPPVVHAHAAPHQDSSQGSPYSGGVRSPSGTLRRPRPSPAHGSEEDLGVARRPHLSDDA
jgi:hypothetical protein